MKICIASGNLHKINEISSIVENSFPNLNLQLTSIKDLSIAEPDEPYATFMENACHKARYYANFTNMPTLSEDSGLCIEALNDFPGVKTKDFAVQSGSLNAAFNNLEQMLAGKNNYNAYFICAAALYLPLEEKLITYVGKDFGKISFPARGDKCFGFDPIFCPQGYEQTMAELGDSVKNVSGHRALAIKGIIGQLINQQSSIF